ncbi:hypothetical protein ACJX0J_017318, partial [Zea mays]
VQGKQDYKDILQEVQDSHHDVYYVLAFLSQPNVCLVFEVIDFLCDFRLIGECEKRKKLEEKGIIIQFVISHNVISGGIVDRSIEAEDRKHGDFMKTQFRLTRQDKERSKKVADDLAAALFAVTVEVKQVKVWLSDAQDELEASNIEADLVCIMLGGSSLTTCSSPVGGV